MGLFKSKEQKEAETAADEIKRDVRREQAVEDEISRRRARDSGRKPSPEFSRDWSDYKPK